DVDPDVTDALEVGDELERHRDEAEVGRDRLPLGQDAQAHVVDLDLEAVDLMIEVDHLPGELAVTLGERPDARLDHLLDLGAHEQDVLAQRQELPFVLAICMFLECHPNRPVMKSSVRESPGCVNSASVSAYSTSSPR